MSQAPKKQVRCAVYTRKSSEEGLEQSFNSLDAQREACLAYVLSQAGEGWSAMADHYDDGGYSGGTLERPALTRLLGEVEQGRIDVVVVYKVDRLTRSLADFARIVDVLDRAGASFVSVTQAFNTTTSMGRLTLNVLLSFAQFEREVTGERIRDKIAASKKKGLWMGGNLALGYDPHGRTLRINETEAEVVRHIYRRYLALGSVHKLQVELREEGYRSKVWTAASSGRVHGGCPFGRGPLFHILSNRLYLGEIPHKGEHHAGQHPAIVDPELFDAVQQALAKNAGPHRRARAGLAPRLPAAPLTGLIYDDAGHRMSPVRARKGSGPVYRYYVSSAVQKGRAAQAGSLRRAPAEHLESLVVERLRRLSIAAAATGEERWLQIRSALTRVIVSRGVLQLGVRRSALPPGQIALQQALAALHPDELELMPEELRITIRAVLTRRGQAKVLIGPGGAPAIEQRDVDKALLKGLVQGVAWRKRLVSRKALTIAEIARQEGVKPAYCERMIRLSFMAPDLKKAVLEGRAPTGLMLERLKKVVLPDDWEAQRRLAYAPASSSSGARLGTR